MKSFETRTGSAAAGPATRRFALLHLLILLALAAVLLPALSPSAVVGHGVVIKAFFVGRIVLLLGVATWFLRLEGADWAATGLRRPSWWRTLLAVPLGAVTSAVCVGLVGAALGRVGVHAADYGMFAPLRGDLGEYLFWALPVTWGTAAIGEELLFRGFVLSTIEKVLGSASRVATVAAIILQAAIFGALHLYQGVGGAATAGTIGLVLGVVWLLTGRNLWAGIAIHGLFDFSAMTAFYLGAVPHH